MRVRLHPSFALARYAAPESERTRSRGYEADGGALPGLDRRRLDPEIADHAPRRAGGQRVYDADAIEYLEAVRTAQDLGFSLDEIGVLFGIFRGGDDPSRECRSLAERKLRDLALPVRKVARMRRILRRGLECRCTSVQGC